MSTDASEVAVRSFTFFDLPPELRLMVYEHLSPRRYTRVNIEAFKGTALENRPTWITNYPEQNFHLVSKQFSAEFSTILYEQMTLVACLPDPFAWESIICRKVVPDDVLSNLQSLEFRFRSSGRWSEDLLHGMPQVVGRLPCLTSLHVNLILEIDPDQRGLNPLTKEQARGFCRCSTKADEIAETLSNASAGSLKVHRTTEVRCPLYVVCLDEIDLIRLRAT